MRDAAVAHAARADLETTLRSLGAEVAGTAGTPYEADFLMFRHALALT